MAARGFNPRTRTGCDRRRWRLMTSNRTFQSTHPHGVRPGKRASRSMGFKFQSTHPHGVRREVWHVDFDSYGVSIHAPARGATRGKRCEPAQRAVSIHAPARGATNAKRFGGAIIWGFNPRTRTGCDGRTRAIPLSTGCFNPRTRTGCDARLLGLADGTRSFNPRTRTGCDEPTRARAVELAEFQSTHPHGVRLAWLQFRPPCPCFNPRTRTGCDHKEFRRALVESCFNPRTRTGCDLLGASISRLGGWFQSTHPHGVRLSHYAIRSGSEQTSIHFFKVREANRAR